MGKRIRRVKSPSPPRRAKLRVGADMGRGIGIGLTWRWWLLAVAAFFIILVLLSLVVLVPAGVRALPGRYAARLPDFLRELRHRPHPDTLPTPAVAVTLPTLSPPTPTAPRLSGVTVVTATPGAQDPPLVLSTPTQPPPTPSPLPTVTPSPAPELPIRASLPPVTHTAQTWNNCGPATLSMMLRYFERSETQAEAANFLKPDPEDKNVSPHEMVAYARSLGLEATLRVGGDLERLKGLIAAGLPVIVETWFIPEPGDQMGHYRLLTGYDDDVRQFITQDSYNGPNVRVDYDVLDELWRVFNRLYVVVYRPSQAEAVAALLGRDVDDRTMYVEALETAQQEATYPDAECVAYEECADAVAFAWFNIGSNLEALGYHQEAAAAYDQARLQGLPWRMLWYQFGPYESYYAVERYEDVVTLATATLNVVDNLEESHYWRGLAYLAQGDTARARADFEAAIEYNANFRAAVEALESLE